MEDVCKGLITQKPAAGTYNIPKSTLQLKLKVWKGHPKTETLRGGGGQHQVLDVIQEFMQINKFKTPFKGNRPDGAWFRSFSQRHKLSIKPEVGKYTITSSRLESTRSRQAADPFILNYYFDKLKEIFHQAADVKLQQFLLAYELMILHKGKRLWDSMFGSEKSYPVTSYFEPEKGWMTEEVFYKFPALLKRDGHLSHVGIKLIEKTVEMNIVILKLPPHTSNLLQPLDVTPKSKSAKITKRKNPHVSSESEELAYALPGDSSFEEDTEELELQQVDVAKLKQRTFVLVEFTGDPRNSTKYRYVCIVQRLPDTENEEFCDEP
ncbi:hypothetical protein PR048_025539, partial [Dryococelus australis]